jgi:DtxR family Mn-dependent transcriptional regulator
LLGVSKSSVTGALRLLKEKNLANYEPYGYVTLTRAGQAAAAEVTRKHNILKSFFVKVLGIEAHVAQEAACKVEHALGPAIITKLLHFIEFMTQTDKNGCDVANEFKRFCEKQVPEKQQRNKPRRREPANGEDTKETVVNG